MGNVKFIDTDKGKTIGELQNKIEHKTLVLWAVDCAERVLPFFEESHPDDKRLREAVEAGRAWLRGELTMSEARIAAFAAHGAARETEGDAACAAARSAGQAAASAHVAGHAVHAATYAAKAITYSSYPANRISNTSKEREWQLQHLLDLKNGGEK